MKVTWSAMRRVIAPIMFVALAMTGVVASSAKADGSHLTIRATSLTTSNSTLLQGDADYWISQGWIGAGARYLKTYPLANSTTNITWNVKDEANANVAGATVVMVLGKAYSCSTAVDEFTNMDANGTFTYMGGSSPGNYIPGSTKTSGNGWCGQSWNSSYALGVTNASGNVTFSVKNFGKNALKDQVTAFVNDIFTDSVDVVDLKWTAANIPAQSKTFNFETASGTSNYSQPFDQGDAPYATTSVVTLNRTTNKLGARTSGKVLKYIRGWQDYSGFDLVSLQDAYSILSNDKPTVKFDVFNAQSEQRTVLVKMDAGNSDSVEKRVDVAPGWSTVSIDFSTIAGFNATKAQYARLIVFPTTSGNWGATPGGVSGDVMYFDNVVFNTYITKKAPQAAPVINSVVGGTGNLTVTYTGIDSSKNGGYDVTYEYRVGTGAWVAAPASPFVISGLTKGSKVVGMRAVNIVNAGLAATKSGVVK